MKPEKPASDWADFSGKSNDSRRPEATATDTAHQAVTESMRMGKFFEDSKIAPVPLHQRGISVSEHAAFRETLAPNPGFDEIDELAGDPMIERHGKRRNYKDAAGVLSILDELEWRGT